jgi:hypothetical protein
LDRTAGRYANRFTGVGAVVSLLERVLGAIEDYPPSAPLSVAQRNFLRLHVKYAVDMWQWHFCKTQLRAHVGRRRATIWVAELDDLIARGLMSKGHGATVYATQSGCEAVGQ